jgi:hypothetical protein
MAHGVYVTKYSSCRCILRFHQLLAQSLMDLMALLQLATTGQARKITI